jgi:cytochrome bd ubiquinol oxidase subunit II
VIAGHGTLLNPIELATWIAVIAAVWLVFSRAEGWAFAATTVTMAVSVLSIFVDLYPRVMVSSTSPASSLTVHNTASGHYSLIVMTVVAVVLLPFVLVYQAWTYYVFRRRVGREDFTDRSPAAAPRSSPAWNDGRSAGEASDGPRTDRQRS